MITDPLLWFCAALGAFMVGVSKAGITGLSILSIADFVAVFSYRKHTQWHYLWRLFPWTAAGVVLGYFALGRISDHTARILIGWIIVSLAALSFWRRFAAPNEEKAASFHWSVGAVIGMTAGFITLVANAAGPLMAIYLVAMRLPKMEYVGTAAVFFMLLNLFKVPFMVDLGLITTQSFSFNLMLAPAVLLGALAGRWLLKHVNQKLFEQLVLLLSAIGGILLIL